MDLKTIKKAYFIGIGGIGVSAIARMLLASGKEVSGSDRSRSEITEGLEQLGVKIFYDQIAENITSDIDLVVYTIAIPNDHPELARARELELECKTYPEMLGLVSVDKFTIAVAGTHGKTTTTAMIAEMMIASGLDPTVIVGSLMRSRRPKDSPLGASQGESSGLDSSGHTNFIAGQSEYLVVEACEYRRSFLNINPKIIVITNIDADHLDYYQDLNEIQKAFAEFTSRLPAGGYLVCDTSDPLLQPAMIAAERIGATVINYRQFETTSLDLRVPGAHNIKNAQAALSVGGILKIDETKALEALNNFRGTWRRFEFKGQTKAGALVYDDYAHHPTEIKATIAGAREFMTKKKLLGQLWVIFQPHLYSRTKMLLTDFAMSLAAADRVILAPIYAAREPIDPAVSSELLAGLVKTKTGPAAVAESLDEAAISVVKEARLGDLVLVMGAGDIATLGGKLVEFEA